MHTRQKQTHFRAKIRTIHDSIWFLFDFVVVFCVLAWEKYKMGFCINKYIGGLFYTYITLYTTFIFIWDEATISQKDVKMCFTLWLFVSFSAMTIGCVCILVLHQLCHHLGFSLMSILFISKSHTHTHRCGKVSSCIFVKAKFCHCAFSRRRFLFRVSQRTPSVGQKLYMRG